MLTSFAALLFLILGATGLSGLTGRRTEDMLPVAYSGMICILSVFYCLRLVRIGVTILCLFSTAVFFLARNKRDRITPGMIVYLFLCVIYLIFFSGNYVSRHDELRLWGAVPKAIHETQQLQLGFNSPIFDIMQSYPPGQPMLDVFFTAFSSEFSEGALYVAYTCCSAAFFIPALSGYGWKHCRLMAPVGLLFLLTPIVFTSHFEDEGLFGMTLFVDPLLGITAGYCFSLASRKPFEDRFRLAAFSLGLGMLCLLKNTGILFGVAALICAVISDRGKHKIHCLLPIVSLSAAFFGWRWLLATYDVHEHVAVKGLTLQGVFNVLRALVSVNMVGYKIPLGFVLSFTFLFAVMLVTWVFLGKLSGSSTVVPSVGIFLASACFLFGYTLYYGETLESLARYMATPLLCLATCILLTALPLCSRKPIANWFSTLSRGSAICLTLACAVTGISVCAIWVMLFPPLAERAFLDDRAEQIRQAVLQDPDRSGSGWIYLVMAGDGIENSHVHHRIYFDLISEDINIRNGLGKTQVVEPGLENPARTWAEELKKGYEYVFLYTLEDSLMPVFKELSDEIPEEYTLYRVCQSDNPYGISLTAVG